MPQHVPDIPDNPICWVCQQPATHVNTGPPGRLIEQALYTCDQHAYDIDDTPIDELTA